MRFCDAFEQRLPFFEVGGGFGDAVAILRDALFGRRGGGLLLRDGGAFVGGQ